MYQGKRCNRKSNRKFQKSALLLVSMMVLVTTVFGGTIAYLLAGTDSVENTFLPSKVTTDVLEDNTAENVKSNVRIKNTGDTSAYIRAAVVINWQTADGKLYGKVPVAGTDYEVKYGSGWQKSGDLWYYKGAVNSQGETGALIESLTAITKTIGDNGEYALTVTILGSGIQSIPDAAVKAAWGDGALSLVKG